MKNEKLLNAIGDLDEDLISEAANDTRKNKGWGKWGSLAAVLALFAGAGIFAAGMFTAGILDVNTKDDGLPNTDILEAENLGTSAGSLESDIPDSINGEIFAASNSIVILDVNPSIALTVNTDEKVIIAEGLNEDGNIVLNDMDLAGVDMTVAVNAIIGSMLQKGYLSDLQNAILVSVENEDAETSAALQQRVSAIIGSAFRDGNLEGSVLSQTLIDTSDLEMLAQEYHISLGKAALIQEVMSRDATLTAEKLTPLSITEIALISQSKNLSPETLTQNGSASDKAYISREAAMEAAYGYANINAEDAFGVEVEFDSEDGIMVYEVEFRVGTVKYECDINARTGQVVKYETENKGSSQAGNSAQPPSPSQQPSGQYIGEDAARETALAKAGVSPDTVKYINSWIEYDDGRPEHYKVEFAVGGVEYEYEIDLYSGAVLKQEMEDHGSHGKQPGASDADIGADAARDAALAHAGLTASQVTKLKTDFEYDDGIALYEVEFEYDRYEYEYKIDAATGTVLEYEIDD